MPTTPTPRIARIERISVTQFGKLVLFVSSCSRDVAMGVGDMVRVGPGDGFGDGGSSSVAVGLGARRGVVVG